MSLIDLQRDMQRVCLEAEAPKDALARLGDERVWSLYREMVRRRLYGELKYALKRTYSDAGEQLFAAAFDAYLAQDPPTERHFCGIPCGFSPFAASFFPAVQGASPHLADLVRFEAARWLVSDLDGTVEDPGAVGELTFEGCPVFSPALRILRLEHGVHRTRDEGAYPEGRFFVALHRAADDQPVNQWQLNETTFALIEHVQAHSQCTLSEAVKHVSEALNVAVDEQFLERLCSVLADFVERKILLGSR